MRKNGATGIFVNNGDTPDISATPRQAITMSAVLVAQNGVGQKSVGSSGIRIASGGICEVDFDGVISSANENGDGVSMNCNRGGEMRMKDVKTTFNYGSGISLKANVFASTMDLEGTITSQFNGKSGLAIYKTDSDAWPVNYFKLHVTGEVNLDSNGMEIAYWPGFRVKGNRSELDVVVKDGGSFQSCDNKQSDVSIAAKDGFTWDGDLTCDPNKSTVWNPSAGHYETPNCVPCPSSSP